MSFNAKVWGRNTFHGFTRHSDTVLHRMLSSSVTPYEMLCQVDGRRCDRRGKVGRDEWCREFKNVAPDFNGRCRKVTLRRKSICYTEVEV